jgi:hypothetical protein
LALEIMVWASAGRGRIPQKLALEHLGFGPCHHLFEVRDNPDLQQFGEEEWKQE